MSRVWEISTFVGSIKKQAVVENVTKHWRVEEFSRSDANIWELIL